MLRKKLDPLWLAAIGDTQIRLQNIAKFLDQKDEYYNQFDSVKEIAAGLPDTRLRSVDSSLDIHTSDNLLLDLALSVDATEDSSGSEDLKSLTNGAEDVCTFIASAEIAPVLSSLYLWRIGAGNGIAQINLGPYVDGVGKFTHLKQFATNFSNEDGSCIIGISPGGYDEAGVLAKLLKKCPMIEELSIPSAPNHEFFSVGNRPLKKLSLKAGFDTQNFIHNLCRSKCFPQLEELDYYDGDPIALNEQPTPFEHFVELFESPTFSSVRTVKLSNVALNASQIRRLKTIRKKGVTITPRR
jgi:hypothetical protein